MSSTYGENLRLTIFGQSHSAAIGVTVEGLPAGFPIDMEALQAFLNRRAPGRDKNSTTRREPDMPEFLSGLTGSVTCGAPLTAIIRNTNTRSGDYEELAYKPRPGHADYTGWVKYGESRDYAGGGHFSGRLTAPLCIVGGICLQLLAKEGITVRARIRAVADVTDDALFTAPVSHKAFPTVSDDAGDAMQQRIAAAKAEGDSVGGVVECIVDGLPAGLGDPMFGGMENRIAAAVFGIPAVKGVEFGDGFEIAKLRGSHSNDPFCMAEGQVITASNHCGGILGGITNGMPLILRAAFKPTPSIGMEQDTVDLRTMTNTTLTIHGRHDPCIVHRAVPCVEAAVAVAVYDAFLQRKKER